MTTKVLLYGSIALVIYLYIKKRNKAKEDRVFEDALAKNEIPCEEKIQQIMLNIDAYIEQKLPYIRKENRMDDVIDLVSVDDFFEIDEG